MAQTNRTGSLEQLGRVRWGRLEGLALVRQWERSGLSASEFCRAHGVTAHRLQYWKRRSQEPQAQAREATPEFFAVLAGAGDVLKDAGKTEERLELSVEICLSPSIRVRVPLAAGASAFVQTLRGVMELVAR
jgi:transposase-like protein